MFFVDEYHFCSIQHTKLHPYRKKEIFPSGIRMLRSVHVTEVTDVRGPLTVSVRLMYPDSR